VAYFETIQLFLWNDCRTTVSLDEGSPSVGRDLKTGFSKYESGGLSTGPRRCDIFNAFGHDCTAESYTISPWFT
jgi:hypothetical protein